jgi:precorrin-2 dehydrogenase/sirohydrochlorin ferrochelatase
MKYLPVGLDVRGRICIVVGGGRIGTRKVINLLRAGAKVSVISPEASDEVKHLAASGKIEWREKEYAAEDLGGSFLTVAATNDNERNAQLVRDAVKEGVLVCDASSASRSDLIFGAIHKRKGITLAVFTDGKDPSLARRTRDRIAELGPEWDET